MSDASSNKAQADDTQCMALQLAPSQFIPASALRPDVTILQTDHLRPCSVKHEHTAEDVLSYNRTVNAYGGSDNHSVIRFKNTRRLQTIDASARTLQPAQLRCQRVPSVRDPVRTKNLYLLETREKFIGIGNALHLCLCCLL